MLTQENIIYQLKTLIYFSKKELLSVINNSKGVALVSDYKKNLLTYKSQRWKKRKIIIEDSFYDFKKGYFQYCIFWNIH